LANQYFSGGGHKNAAGGKTDRNLSETVELFKKIIVKYNKELENKTPIESYDEF
jgi:phosphoesterase RecJ-like protein